MYICIYAYMHICIYVYMYMYCPLRLVLGWGDRNGKIISTRASVDHVASEH